MSYRLYAGQHVWLLVPECMLPSIAAVEQHGPLRLMGLVMGTYASEKELARIETDLEGRFFVEIPVDLAKRLLAELDGR